MRKNQTSITLLDELASDTVPESVDLWPGVADIISARRRVPHVRLHGGQIWRIAATMAVLILSVIMLSPVQQTIADTIQHFGILETNSTKIQQSPPAVGVTAISEPVAMYSLEEAQKRVPYTIPQPSWIPSGFHLRGVFVGTDGSVSLSYVPDGWTENGSGGGFGLSVRRGSEAGFGGIAIPVTAIQHATLNGAPALYARGAWEDRSNGMTWHADDDAARVAWASDGFTYVLSESGVGLGRDDLMRIAESIRR